MKVSNEGVAVVAVEVVVAEKVLVAMDIVCKVVVKGEAVTVEVVNAAARSGFSTGFLRLYDDDKNLLRKRFSLADA